MVLNQDVRAFLPQVKFAVKSRANALVDARTHDEYTAIQSCFAIEPLNEGEFTNGPIPCLQSGFKPLVTA